MSNTRDSSTGTITATGGCCLINLLLGGWTFDYCLQTWFGKDVPWFADMAAGLVLGQFTIPLAIASWVATLWGVEAPFIR